MEFEQYLNDGKEITLTIVDYFFSSSKYFNYKHSKIDFLFEKYKKLIKEVKYNKIGTYILFNAESLNYYIGSGNIESREYRHFYDLKCNKHSNSRLQHSYNKNNNFKFYYIETKNRKEALAFEQFLLDHFYNDYYCLNLTKSVELPTLGMNHSDETKIKLSNHFKKMWENPEIYSKVFNNVSNEKRRKNITGRIVSDITKNKIKKALNRPDVKLKISTKLKGLKRSDEFKNKMRNIKLGTKHTVEAIEKIRRNSTGRKQSNETIEKRKRTFFINNTKEKVINTWSKKIPSIFINGVTYRSIREASRILNIRRQTITYRLSSNKFINWYKI